MQDNLFLNRMLIYTNAGEIAYDEIFHKGVNIIRGDNSSGKSTITHFIFFALGGDFSDFVPEARQCQVVYAEVDMNGAVLTIKRYIEINEKGKINSRILGQTNQNSKAWYGIHQRNQNVKKRKIYF